MNEINLTSEQKLTLEEQHKKVRDSKECDRIKAVLLRSEDWSTPKIAQALRIHETTVLRHVDDYLSNEKLKPQNGGSSSHLNEKQTRILIDHLDEHVYLHVHQIVHYIKKTWNIEYSISGLTSWLHHNNFSYKQPKKIPHKFCPKKQEVFIKHYEELKSRLASNEAVLFMDAVHPTQATKVTSGWIRKGQDKPIETTGSRTRLNIIGAIELANLSKGVFEKFETINGESIIEFLKQIKKSYKESSKIHLILDGAGYHRSLEVKNEVKKMNIELHYLPPYSPNLNPIERLWKVMNEQVRNNKYFESAKEFREKIGEFFAKIYPKIADSLSSRINDKFQKLNPAS